MAALIERVCGGCGRTANSDGRTLSEPGWVAFVDDGRETGRYMCPACWPYTEPPPRHRTRSRRRRHSWAHPCATASGIATCCSTDMRPATDWAGCTD